MKLTEIINNLDDDGFVVLHEGVGSASVARVRDLVAKAKGIAASLDDKLEAKFKAELNRKLSAFNDAANKGNVRSIDSKAAAIEAIVVKYANKA